MRIIRKKGSDREAINPYKIFLESTEGEVFTKNAESAINSMRKRLTTVKALWSPLFNAPTNTIF